MGILKGFLRIATHTPLSVKESNSIFTKGFSNSSFSKELAWSTSLVEHIT